jgi:hypothetical protein
MDEPNSVEHFMPDNADRLETADTDAQFLLFT